MVKKIWHFIGLPDPDENTERKKIANTTKKSRINPPIEELKKEEVKKDTQTTLPTNKINWDGPITPKGEPFHDLGVNQTSRNNILPSKALRYVTPNSMNRLPIEPMASRLYQGDVVIVDLSVMVHMESQQRACRQSLRQLSSERRIPIFSLDNKDNLLMMPGKNIQIDVTKYDLI
ncbi:MAG: hypothetical protein CMA27_01425 [Euryarchaeota archaeon]|nr:hypothetical protein [Euryarchaeota archaeon]|tara:strand:- start:1382 stop:1906 length:525 start_codon:yes stop_codon:yes gene_type:complete